jgi:hypothetical protein
MKPLCILLAFSIAHVSARNVSSSKGERPPSVGRSFYNFVVFHFETFFDKGNDNKAEPQPILVINAGHGRTGTATYLQALKRLGLKCYHMKEGVLETHGHLDLWANFLLDKSITFDDVMSTIADDGFNATADAPMNFFYKKQMKRFPDAPVILSIRPEEVDAGDAWQRSLHESVFRFVPIVASIPYRWLPGLRRFCEITILVNNMLTGELNGKSEKIDPTLLTKAYYDWIDDVKATVPSDKLLIYKVMDGWEPLCRHISHVSPIVAANCRQVLETNEPFPHMNDRQSVQRVQFTMRCITMATYALMAILPCLCWHLVFRRKRSGKDKRD